MKLLFICSAGQNRSPTARDLWLHDNPEDDAIAVGIYAEQPSELTRLLEWADKVVVMEHAHVQEIIHLDDSVKTCSKIINFDIPDIYPYNDPELVRLLNQKCGRYREMLTQSS